MGKNKKNNNKVVDRIIIIYFKILSDFCKIKSNKFKIFLFIFSDILSKKLKNFLFSPRSDNVSATSILEASPGMNVRDTKKLIITEIDIASAMSLNS